MNLLINETLLNETNGSSNNSLTNGTTSNDEQSSDCLPSWILNAIGVKSVYASDTTLTVVHIPFAIFAFLSNLAVIVTIIRTPSLHVPVNVLLCGLAAADCLTGLVVQPVYVSWRFLLHHLRDPCSLVHLYQASKSLPFLLVGCTFLNLAITSVDRLYAVAKPFAYRTVVTFQGMSFITYLKTRWSNARALAGVFRGRGRLHSRSQSRLNLLVSRGLARGKFALATR